MCKIKVAAKKNPWPNSPLTQKNNFYFDSMYTKERTHLLEPFDVGSKDGPAVTVPNGIFWRYNGKERPSLLESWDSFTLGRVWSVECLEGLASNGLFLFGEVSKFWVFRLNEGLRFNPNVFSFLIMFVYLKIDISFNWFTSFLSLLFRGIITLNNRFFS